RHMRLSRDWSSDVCSSDLMVRDELLEKRFHSLDVLERTVEGGEVDEETLSSWMWALNDLRLVLGTRLDVSEDDDPMDIDPDDPLDRKSVVEGKSACRGGGG